MKIVIMRHGEAEHFADSDAERELTERGRSESLVVAQRCAAEGYHQFDKVLVSPYIRAQQTWQVISECFQASNVEECPDITPYGHADTVYDYLCALMEVERPKSVLLVSHLPLVGYLTSEFVPHTPPMMFPTSGMVCIEFDPEQAQGHVVWQMRP